MEEIVKNDEMIYPVKKKEADGELIDDENHCNKETKKMAETCISFLEKFRDNGHSRADDCIKWLENMMDCRSVIDTAVCFLNEFKEKGYENAAECIEWLEGIKRNSVPDSVFMAEENCEPEKEGAVELNMEDGSCVEFLEKFSSSVSGSAASKLKAVAKCLEKSMLSAALTEIYMDELKNKVRFYEEFLSYLHKNAIGNTENIVDAVNDVSRCDFIGYVDVFKSINDNQQLVLEFTTPEGEKKKALWSADDNYAVWQTCGIAGDDYSGYLLFPTQNENSYFCIYYDS